MFKYLGATVSKINAHTHIVAHSLLVLRLVQRIRMASKDGGKGKSKDDRDMSSSELAPLQIQEPLAPSLSLPQA